MHNKDVFEKENDRISQLLSCNTFFTVSIVNKAEQPNEYWVQPNWRSSLYLKVAKACKNAAGTVACVHPELDALCMVDCEQIWCRARVININPLRVFYIDFGDSEYVRGEELRELPLMARDAIPLAVKIKLAEGTPSKYHSMFPLMEIKIKAVELLPDI